MPALHALSAHPYSQRAYAEALAGAGAVIPVPEWGAHLIRRPLPEGLCDATGVYPLQVFARGADSRAGLSRLAADGLVSAVLTPDPLLCPAADLARDFEVFRPFKPHYVVDPSRGAKGASLTYMPFGAFQVWVCPVCRSYFFSPSSSQKPRCGKAL